MLNVGSLFSGAGLLDYGLASTGGFEHAWFCEADGFRRGLLERRWPGVPVFDDVRTVGADSVRRVDVLAGGFPCKGASTAGKRNGFDHPETVLWREMRRAVGELQPRYVLVENVANILGLHGGAVWGEVLGDLATLGFDAVWDCLPAASVGAPHLRDRVFAIATHPGRSGRRSSQRQVRGRQSDVEGRGATVAHPDRHRLWQQSEPERRGDCQAELAGTGEALVDTEGRSSRCDRAQAKGGLATEPDGGRPVEWGEYEPAIRRWERVHGPAPAPLTGVRGVDARDAKVRRLRARMDRQRLSALGDGVHVYVARLAGERILELEEQHMRERAA